jgi:hypothetical protein
MRSYDKNVFNINSIFIICTDFLHIMQCMALPMKMNHILQNFLLSFLIISPIPIII